MLVSYSIYCATYLPDSLNAGEADTNELEIEDSGNLADVVRYVVRLYGIVANNPHDDTLWWGTNHPVEDRDYYQRGIQKYYTFHIQSPALSARNRERINRMLKSLW